MLPQKILIVTSKSAGGSGRHIEVLGKGLKSRNVEVDLLYYAHGFAQDNEIEKHFNVVHRFPQKLGFNFGFIMNLIFLKNTIKRNNYTIVHSHTSLGGLISRLAAISFTRGERATVHTLHAFAADQFTPQPQKTIYYIMEKLLDTVTNKYVAPSFFSANYGIKIKIFNERKVTTIHNALELQEPKTSESENRSALRKTYKIKDTDCVFLFCGRLEEQKGLYTLLDAFALTLQKCDSVKLLLIGDGAQEEDLKRYAVEKNIAQNIIFAGWQTDVSSFYAASNVFVMSSIWESFGLVFLEAMNYSLPVIASKTQGIPEVIIHGETGFLCEIGNAHEFSEKMLLLAGNQKKRKQFGAAGKLRLKTHFAFEKFIDSHVNLYKKLDESLRR